MQGSKVPRSPREQPCVTRGRSRAASPVGGPPAIDPNPISSQRGVTASASTHAPGDDARRRARACSYGMTVVAADRQYGPVPHDLNHLEYVMRHHPDDAGRGAARGSAPMRPIAREIVLRSGIAADHVPHFPTAPGGRAAIGGFVWGIELMRNVRIMKMMSTQVGCARCARCNHLKGCGKQKDRLEFHYALQRFGATERSPWFDVFCGEGAV